MDLRGKYDVINIKLDKTGGLTEALALKQEAEALGLKVMVGAMIEGPIAIAAGVQFAVSLDNAILTDLDTDLDLPEYTDGHCAFDKGARSVADAPGLGVTLNDEKLEKSIRQKQVVLQEIS